MGVTTTRLARSLVAGVAVVTATACGSGAPEPVATPDPAVRPYCDTVARVQAEQNAPDAGQRGVAASSAATRRQLAALVRTAPPEIAGQWRTVAQLTERSLGVLAATGGDPRRIDRAALDRLRRAAEPEQARIATVTTERCGIAFRGPAG